MTKLIALISIALTSCEITINKDHVAEGNALLASGDISSALLQFDDALFIDQANLRAIRGKYICYMQLRKFDMASEQANKFINLAPAEPAGYSDRGTAYMMTKQYEKALQDFDRVIELDTSYPTIAYFNKGEVLKELKQYSAAVRCYDAVTQKDTTDARAFFKKGLAYLALGFTDSACLSFQRASLLGDEDAKDSYKKSCE